MLANGMTPPEPVKIYLDCDGRRRPAGYTNSKGTFSVDLNDRNTAFADASIAGMGQRRGLSSSGLGRVNLFGCQLLAELGGYQADPIQLGTRSVFDNPNVGTMILQRLDGVEGTSISFTSLSAPKKAKKAYDKAFREMQKGEPNLQKAEKELETAVGLHSEYATAWNLLGRIRMMQDNREGGRTAFEKAVEADPKFLDPYAVLAHLALTEERWDDGLQWSNQLLRLNPHASMAHYYSAIANFRLGRMEASKKSVLELKEKSADREFPQSHQILGMIHAQQGLYEQAAISYRDYLTVQPDGPVASQIQRQLHEWEVLGVIQKKEAVAPTAVVPQN
jgi:Tfp pilus assembly protein PilF